MWRSNGIGFAFAKSLPATSEMVEGKDKEKEDWNKYRSDIENLLVREERSNHGNGKDPE